MQKNRKKFISLDTKSKIRDYFFKYVKKESDLLYLINIINEQQYLKVTPITLSYITYHAYKNQSKYKMFRIPKKSGKKRQIIAPNKGLKGIQNSLNIILQSIYKPHISAHGFIHSRSVITNALKHTNKNYVYNIDLEDFFPSIHQSRVWKRLQTPPFNMSQKLANLVSALTCYQYKQGGTKRYTTNKNFLPQGASTSPVISNIICERLDKKLYGIAKRFNLTYTRYADDITFSSSHNVYQQNSLFINELKRVIENEHFMINSSKTRLQKRGTRQVVTGIVVNEKVNINRRYIKHLRMLIHLLEKFGIDKAKKIYIEHLQKESINKGFKSFSKKDIVHVISGKLEYIRMIKGSDDTTFQTLKGRFDKSFLVEAEHIKNHNPQKMIALLKLFEQEEVLQATVNPIITNQEYLKFIVDLYLLWEKLYKENKNIVHNSLLSKIYVFLLQGNVAKNGWGVNRIKCGWSSSQLKKWIIANPEKSPYEFKLKQDNLSKTSTFKDVMIAFKDEIKISSDGNNSLYNIFFEIFDNQDQQRIRPISTRKDDILLKEVILYVDTQQIKFVLNHLADKFLGLRSELYVIKTQEYIELQICLLDNLYGIENELSDDNFGMNNILKHMVSMCDFRVESHYNNSSINNLLGQYNGINTKINAKGTTLVLRFYL